MNDLLAFTQGCLDALYFTETGAITEGQPPYWVDLDPESRLDLEADCRSFWHRFGCYVLADEAGPGVTQAGHDFWFTRNGHGAGFWDGDWPLYGDLLTDASQGYGEFYPDFEEE